ncbi:MAG: hypothetical protein KC729_15115 [Candidatus Eisenbacteria bacterium]|uniref:Uncharacterized protein n=1 Tax=Eiseniibacteriota bacterium TaxID=2212470 RepID=A0A956M322_UNCEI|nr:hypothetical protein [Candidatus Eisenbacteria bacterium]
MTRLRTPIVLLLAVLLFRFVRGSILLLGAALAATILALFGTKVVRKRTVPPPVSGRRPRSVDREPASKPYDPALVVDARYEEIE